MTKPSDRAGERGFSLIETVISLGVLTVGMLGAAAVFTQGMARVTSSPGDLVATQKAGEAIESVYSARDTRTVTWALLQNVAGATGHDGGIFLDGPQDLRAAGADGLVGTADDGAWETVELPGPDQVLGTADDTYATLTGFTREIRIRDVTGSQFLRSITVIVTYKSGPTTRTHTLVSYISNYS